MEPMSKLILVTGGSRGIGAASARHCARLGFSVVVNYRSDSTAALRVCSDIEAEGGCAVAIGADVSSDAGVAKLFESIDGLDLPLHGLVNNAGIVEPVMPFTDYSEARLRRTFDTNLLGPFLCAREAVKRMLAQNSGGAIVNVSSAAARLGSPNEFIDYAASKGALDTFTLGLAKEFGPHGIRVNAVRPGLINTSIHARAGDPERVERFVPQVPMRRAGEPEEVAETIAWLLTDAASYITGALLDVAGGR